MPFRRLAGLAAAAGAAVVAAGFVAPAHSSGELASRADAARTYTVRPGDTLSAVAARHGVGVQALVAANRITRADQFRVGRVLVVPAVRAATVDLPAAGVTAPGTDVPHTASQQVVVADRTAGLRGTWSRYEWRAAEGRWAKLDGPGGTTFGYGGVKPGPTRVQGDGSTPSGTYRLLYAFGRADPGTALEYRPITACSWWVGSREGDYNRWRESCADPPADGERMLSYLERGQYEQGVVIGFNYDRPILRGPGSGTGIFLHFARGNTAGCVGLTSMKELTETVRWLDPAADPVIVIKG